MKKFALALVVLALLVAPALAGSLTIRTTPPIGVLKGDPAELVVEFWITDVSETAPLLDITGIEVIPTFTYLDTDVASKFALKPDPSNPFTYAVWVNPLWVPSIPFVAGNMIGFVDAFNPGENVASETKMMTITYNYTFLADGDYFIGMDPAATGLTDSNDKVDVPIVDAKFVVGIPEPCTMALLGCGLVGLIGYGRKRIRK